MAIIISQIESKLEESTNEILDKAFKITKLEKEDIKDIYLVKSSVDARRKDKIRIISSVGIETNIDEEKVAEGISDYKVNLQKREEIEFKTGKLSLENPPVIVGFGPAGMFAGLALARMGYSPIIIERGSEVETRVKKVNDFWNKNYLDTETNVQFGEGGAGTFSDGKLTTRINDPLCTYIIDELINHGAPKEIRERQKPHIGTDLLRGIVKKIREDIIELGGTVRFNEKVKDIHICNGEICSVVTDKEEIPTGNVILAIGHSARDTFSMLIERGIIIEPKAFSVGLRIEQRQEVIDRGLYGKYAGNPALPKGEYQLSWRQGERGVYTFCMCPGGVVVPSSSEEHTIVTNGMSIYARDGVNANSAVVVSVDTSDFGANPLSGIEFQTNLEKQAYLLGGANYSAPVQSAKSFLDKSKPTFKDCATKPSFACGVKEADLSSIFSPSINEMLGKGMRLFEQKLKGFADKDAVITGVETRTSSPVRILRNKENMEAVGIKGLYPCGEGAGYAGGIVSAAVDGVKLSQCIISKYKPNRG